MDRVRQGFLRKSARNRRFFDHLCLLIWCECREGCTTKSKSWQEWCDVELFSYHGLAHGVSGGDFCETPRQKLSVNELDYIQAFINTHTFRNLLQAKLEIGRELFNDCIATALNILDCGTVEDARHPGVKDGQLRLKVE